MSEIDVSDCAVKADPCMTKATKAFNLVAKGGKSQRLMQCGSREKGECRLVNIPQQHSITMGNLVNKIVQDR